MEDSFQITGRAGDKESLPVTIRVLIQSINDQPPIVVNNTGLELWEGSSAIITPSHLGKKLKRIFFRLFFEFLI